MKKCPLCGVLVRVLMWFKKRAINRLKVELAGVEAKIKMESHIQGLTKTVYPGVMAENAKQQARLKCRIEQLEAA